MARMVHNIMENENAMNAPLIIRANIKGTFIGKALEIK